MNPTVLAIMTSTLFIVAGLLTIFKATDSEQTHFKWIALGIILILAGVGLDIYTFWIFSPLVAKTTDNEETLGQMMFLQLFIVIVTIFAALDTYNSKQKARNEANAKILERAMT